MTNWFLFLLSNENEGWCHSRRIQVIYYSFPHSSNANCVPSLDPGTEGSKMNKHLNTGIWTDNYVKSWYKLLSVLLEQCTGCHESPEEGTSHFSQGPMGEVTGRWCLGGSWRLCRSLLRKRRNIGKNFWKINNVQGQDSSSESSRKPIQKRCGYSRN